MLLNEGRFVGEGDEGQCYLLRMQWAPVYIVSSSSSADTQILLLRGRKYKQCVRPYCI